MDGSKFHVLSKFPVVVAYGASAGLLAHNLGARLTVGIGGAVALGAAALFARHLSRASD